MEIKLWQGMFDEDADMPAFGAALRSSMQAPNELLYWLSGYAFYKREDGQIFMEEFPEEYKDNFVWSITGDETDFDCMLEEADLSYQQAIAKLEKMSKIALPYHVAPVSFEVVETATNKTEIANIAFVDEFNRTFFVAPTKQDFYNIKTTTSAQLRKFAKNTFANPYIVHIDEDGNVEQLEE